MFKKILIANRGEIAVRIIRACREMDIMSVAICSEADKDALHAQLADQTICIGPAPAKDSYLDMERVLGAAMAVGADAIHPGYFSIMESAIREVIPDFTMTMTVSLRYNGWFILWCIICILILMKVYNTKDLKINVGKEYFYKQYKALGDMSSKEKKAIVMILLLLGYLFSTKLTGLPAAYGFMIIPFLTFLPRGKSKRFI